MSRPIAAPLAACAAVLALALAAGPVDAAAPAASGQLLVGFEQGASSERQQEILAALRGRLAKRFAGIRGGRLTVVKPRSGIALALLRKRLAAHPDVAYVEPDFTQSASATKQPDDPLYPLQYALADEPRRPRHRRADRLGHSAPAAPRSRSSTPAPTPTIPTSSRNLYKSKDKPNNGKDDDKNGYVDDTYGLNAIKGKGSAEDDNGHGTHVAGIVAGRGNNADGRLGDLLDGEGHAGQVHELATARARPPTRSPAIQYAVKQGVKIVNCSFGSSSQVLRAAGRGRLRPGQERAARRRRRQRRREHRQATRATRPPTATRTSSPSPRPPPTTQLASFSNFGAKAVDVAAPGDSILSTYLGGGYKILSGTSMAAPYAAGVAAMLRKQEPDATYGDLRKAIRKKVDKPPALKGKVAYDGRLNACKALQAIPDLVD